MLHDILIPGFGCYLKVAINNVCPDSLYKLKSLSTVKLVRTSIFVLKNSKYLTHGFLILHLKYCHCYGTSAMLLSNTSDEDG